MRVLPWRPGRQMPLHVYISGLFVGVLLVLTAVSVTVRFAQTRDMLLSAARTLFDHVGRETTLAVDAVYEPAATAANVIAASPLRGAETFDARLDLLPMLMQELRSHAGLSAVYAGYRDGDFFLVRRLDGRSPAGAGMAAPPQTAFLVQAIDRSEGGSPSARFRFHDADGRLLADRATPGYLFDPRTRPWYTEAIAHPGVFVSDPYVFFTTREPGATVAVAAGNDAVVGVDVTLDALSDVLRRLRPSPSAELIVFDRNGHVLADADRASHIAHDATGAPRIPAVGELERPVLTRLLERARGGGTGAGTVEIDGEVWQTALLPIVEAGSPLSLAIAAPQSELLADATRIRNRSTVVAFLILGVSLLVTVAISQLASRPLRALTAQARAIRALKFDDRPQVRSFISEIDDLGEATALMQSTLRKLLDVVGVLAGERRLDRLLDRTLQETMVLAGARGGTVYLAEPDGRLRCALTRLGGRTVEGGTAGDLDPQRDAAHPAIRAMIEGSLHLPTGPEEAETWFPGLGEEGPLVTLSIPLGNRSGGIVGVLMLVERADAFAHAEAADLTALMEAVARSAALAIETQRLIMEQKELFQAIIELLAGAIDAKNPYTGGHCQRVPVITEMLARAAAAETDGPFADFSPTEEQWEEIHIAAWLHDCGKITTPEHVIDKATKLEGITDRLHEVRMRFEVAKREAEAAAWRAIADGADRAARLAELDALWRTLDEEFAFVAACNEGSEAMDEAHVARLHRIAARTWTRTLDDRIGLSHEEKQRRARTAPAPLPASEPMLADRPDHIIPRGERDRIEPGNPWGFRLQVPEHLYNRGELANLTVRFGTLTAEERFKINEHIVATIRMLRQLPLPRHLRGVPELAGGHHERVDGGGYPRRLRGDEMSVAARMLAIADVFEALTAADRPYKRAKTLSEAVGIMARMRDEGHIDPDLFALFLRAGIHRRYAERYLPPEQVDEVDEAAMLRAA